jgi:3-hydroxyisobutyrate dehydrogenase-like beta-hydroxyacid dehydrogenase
MFAAKGEKIISEDTAAQFPLKHQQKDLRLALQLGDAHRISMPVCAAANEQYKRAYQYGLEDEDMSALFTILHSHGGKA